MVTTNQPVPPDDLPTSPATFYRGGADMILLDEALEWEARWALERLGPPPFRRGGFPLMGFLETLYQHVSEQMIDPPGERA